MIHQGHKYTHKGEPVIALESTQEPRALVKVIRGPFETGWAPPHYAWAHELVLAPMKYFGGATAVEAKGT